MGPIKKHEIRRHPTSMKVAVYAIAKNEQQFVARWCDSASEADGIYLLDTGSSDATVSLAQSMGVHVRVQEFHPWRFDVARNASLEMIPEDFDWCIALDLDEVLVPGWREELERLGPEITRPRYTYTWSWSRPGVPGLQYGGDKIHRRHGYSWKHPVHEVVHPTSGNEVHAWCGLQIQHFPDDTKSRGQYFPLLELAVQEDPDDDRNAHYLAREYFFLGLFDKSEQEFRRHLSLPSATWGPERAQSCRYLFKITKDPAWLEQAIREAPGRREPWVDLAQYHYENGDWQGCLSTATSALQIKERPMEYLSEDFAWGALPHDLAAISAYNLKYFHQAKYHGLEALKASPYDQRLSQNMDFYNLSAVS